MFEGVCVFTHCPQIFTIYIPGFGDPRKQMSATPATLDMLKIQSLNETTRLLDSLITEHRVRVQELNMEEFAALKAELGKSKE